MKIPLLSFFTGGGFLDMGFENAGFEIVWTNEYNPAFADMYEHGIASWRHSITGKNEKVRISERRSIKDLNPNEVLENAFGSYRPTLFGIIGGPPCPDFSIAGTNIGAIGKHGQLTQSYIDLICQIQPGFFVMENVPGLYKTKKHLVFFNQILNQVENAGYITDFSILNALELGVPQDRERLFLLGFNKLLFNTSYDIPNLVHKQMWFPWPEDIRYKGAKKLPWPGINLAGEEVIYPKGIPLELTVYPLLTDPDPEELPNGRDFFRARSPKFQNREEGAVGSKSFKKLHRFRYSPTSWYGNNEVHLHPWKPRRLSVRETLRIQTVPDGYILPQESSLTAKFKMVCNGVPCLLAERLAAAILDFIQEPKYGIVSKQETQCVPYEFGVVSDYV